MRVKESVCQRMGEFRFFVVHVCVCVHVGLKTSKYSSQYMSMHALFVSTF